MGTNYPNSKEENFDEIKLEFGSMEFNLKIFNGLEEMSNYYEISYEYLIKDILLTISAGDFKPYGRCQKVMEKMLNSMCSLRG